MPEDPEADADSAVAEAALTDRLPAPLFITPDHAALHFEYRQLADGGRERDRLAGAFEEAFDTDPEDPALAERVRDLLDRGPELPLREDYPYHEPTALPELRAARPDHRPGAATLDPETARDAIHGGWLGACAGCLLGKPVQGWTRARIRGFLEDSGQWPLSGYMRGDVAESVADRYDIHTNIEDVPAFVDGVDGMPVDDDIDYIALGLGVLETHGAAFTTRDVGNAWLEELPLMNTYTAERVAYRNLAELVDPPRTATRRNPYREMVGALIRADPWGYAALGAPERAAGLAHRDARLSHVRNGVYGACWVAAMVAAAPAADSIDAVLDAGLGQIPADCRLAESVATVRGWHADGVPAETAVDRLHDRYDETDTYDWVHTLSNAEVITLALLYADGDFADAVTTAVAAGFDTDSHGATVGSVLGAYHGAASLPARFVEPLADTVETSLPGSGRTSISGLADRTYEVWTALSA